MDKATISVIMPCHNAASYVAQAIDSVLSQGPDILELIVIDDASTDESLSVIRAVQHPKIRVLTHTQNGGISSARNAGIEIARGDYLAFLDADDLWTAHAIQDLKNALVNAELDNEKRHWCFGSIEHFYSPELMPKPERNLPPIQIGYFASAMLVKKTFSPRLDFLILNCVWGSLLIGTIVRAN